MTSPRDERGWIIPREGTKSRHIYELLLLGYKSGEIIRLYRCSTKAESSIRVLVFNVKNPDGHNAHYKKWRINNPEAAKAIESRSKPKKTGYSKYALKLHRNLGISLTEAVKIEREQLEKEKCAQEQATVSELLSDTCQM